MNRFFAVALGAALMMMAPAGFAAEDAVNDGFGGSFFTAETPAALKDGDDSDFWADQVSTIEPAAGGDVFIVPGDEDAAAKSESLPAEDRLAVPETPVIPGVPPTDDRPE